MKPIRTTALIISLFAFASYGVSEASVVITGNFNTGIPTATLTISSDVTIPIFNSGAVEFLVFNEWVISDGNITGALPTSAQNVSYQLNSGPVTTVPLNLLVDNLTFSLGVLTANDGYLKFNPINVIAGDVLTFKAGSFTFQPLASFNTAPPAVFNGSAFATGNQGGPLGEGQIVPEPSSALLLALGCSAMFVRRRRA